MLRPTTAFFVLAGLFALAGCRSLPAPGWHNPDKPIGAFDYDFYSCRMIALQTTPPPPAAAPAANALYSQCYVIGNVQQCWQQQAPIYPEQQSPTVPAEWEAKVEALTGECLARQGWTHTPAEAAKPVQ